MKKLFTNDVFFSLMTIFAVVCNLVFAVLVLGPSTYVSLLQLLLRLVFVVVLYFSYRHHNKNLMKGLMGALLTAQFTSFVSYFQGWNLQGYQTVHMIIISVLSLLLLINHFIINSDRHSSPVNVTINQVIVILIAVAQIISTVVALSNSFSTIHLVLQIFNVLGNIGMASFVIIIESRLDLYRQEREAAGWTEEKGYPEGYVHEYEKKNS